MLDIYVNIKSLMGVRKTPVKFLKGVELDTIEAIDDAYLIVEDGIIKDYGKMAGFANIYGERCGANTAVHDLSGRFVFPAFVDSHTHIVYPGSREQEYEDKIRGLSYAEIAKRGGGILNTAANMHLTDEDTLFDMSMQHLQQCIDGGTAAIEIKSGYGLSTEDELKMLRVIRRMKECSPVTIKANFLAAHAFPTSYRDDHDGYVRLIIDEMLPIVAGEGLADFIDVFCDEGFFTVSQTARILEAGIKHGLKPKIHANELGLTGGVQVGVEYGALSVDHLEHVGDAECECLKSSKTIATALPGASFFLGMPYTPLRQMIDSGLAVALASDCNPGSSPSASMKFVLSLASINMRLTPVEALNAATVNAAAAMDLAGTYGQISPGLKANFIITRPMPSFSYFSYSYTENLIEQVVINR